jgi:hypothetical protein
MLLTYLQFRESNPDLPNTIRDTREPVTDDYTKHRVFRDASERLFECHLMTRWNLFIGGGDALAESSDTDDLQSKLLKV